MWRLTEWEKSRMIGLGLRWLAMNGTIIHTENREGGHVLGEDNWISGASCFGDFFLKSSPHKV